MGLKHRPMRPKDVAECAEIIALHPVLGPRYGGRAKPDLLRAWLQLLGSEAMKAAVFEEPEGARLAIRGFGISVFVTDNFVRELKTPPLFWFGPELARRILRGDSPVLSEKQIREANSKEGLNLVVWEALPRPGFDQRNDIYHLMVTSFIEMHRGFLWKEMITAQVESAERLRWALDAGGLLWSPSRSRYAHSSEGKHQEVIRRPHIVGVTRDVEFGRAGSWVGTLFDYHTPQIGFSRGEQKLLLSALSGGTDKEVHDDLGASLSTVKNTWRSIYNRAALRLPELFVDQSKMDVRSFERGKEKKRHLLAYLREHPEELRPVSRKLLRQAVAQQGLSRQYRRT
jgi:hypothetical protein